MADAMATAIKRLTREVAKEVATPTPGVKVNPIAQEPLNFLLHVEGPAEMVAPGETKAVPSPYAGKIFEVLVKCPADYPHKAPTEVAFKLGPTGKSTMFHPLVSEGGEVCGNLWTPHWGATSSLGNLGTMLRTAMAQPTAEAATNPGAMALLQGASKDVAGYCAAAKAACESLPNKA